MNGNRLALIGFVCVLGCAHPSKPRISPGQYSQSIKEGSVDRTYILRVPPAYDNKRNLPLVILYHGWTSSARAILNSSGFGEEADKHGFILVAPNGTDGIGNLSGWNAGFLNLGSPQADDVKFTSDLLDRLKRDLCVDPKRVYIVGHSNGAMMAYDLGAKLSDRVAAIGVVSGTVGIPGAHLEDPQAPVSAIIFHGKEDPTVPYDASHEGLIQAVPAPESAKWWADKDSCGKPALSNSGNNVIQDFRGGRDGTEVEFVTITDGDHDWPARHRVDATSMIWDFLDKHPKP